MNLLLLVSFSQGFVFGLSILFSPFFRSHINKYLGYSILVLTSLMLNVYLDFEGVFEMYPDFMILYDIEWIFLFPVFFFLYILKSINHDLEKNRKMYWLYVPFFFSVVINAFFNLEVAYQWFADSYDYTELVYDWVFGFQEFGYYSFNFILIMWSYKVISEEKYTNYPNNKWLKASCIWTFFLVTLWIIIDIIDMIFGISYEIGISIICTSTSVFIFWLVYNGVYRLKLTGAYRGLVSGIKSDISGISMLETLDEVKSKNQMVLSNSFSEDNRYFQKLENLLKKDYIYRDPNLSQEAIAKRLNISTGYLSQIVNDITKKNFAVYINSYRVQEVKDMILNTEFDKYSVLAIGLEAGFKSKTTFYTSFKKETGLTPSQFKSNHKKVPNF
ncbi:AraC family transcriptional regulator [Aquimarina sp. RZ0]|uniref:helix-turn-helix domain-containing protein n=1 Tax=Aquimarina sp. RZ0 TaxID=2607730 RepID=UPI00165F48DF|nr:helix-turn-helix domain-containing protein [Aquimarina sp. RZ0]